MSHFYDEQMKTSEWRVHQSEIDFDADVSESPRLDVLDEAAHLISGDRNNSYGPPHQDFKRTAEALNAFGYSVNDNPLMPHDVALIISVVKISRLMWSPEKRDSWVDLAGYAACGYEAYMTENGESEDA